MGTAKRERQKANRQQRLEEMARQARKDKTKRLGLRWGLVIVGAFVLLFGLVWLTKDDNKDTTASSSSIDLSSTSVPAAGGAANLVPFTYGTGECAAADGSSTKPDKLDAPKQCIDPAKGYQATFDTNEGKVVVELNAAQLPGTVNNFVNLARYHYYDNTKIFRADSSIDIVQGGGSSPSDPGPYTIPDEGTGFSYQTGDLVMARSQGLNSGGAQYFIAGGPKVANLNGQGTYVVFGHVTEGLDLVTKWIGYADPANPMGIKTPVTVNTITITETDAPQSTSPPERSSTTAAAESSSTAAATETSSTGSPAPSATSTSTP